MPQTFNVGSRSLFVTIVGWIFIVLAAAASASAVLQGAGVALGAELPAVPAWQERVASLPLFTAFLTGNLPWVVGAGTLLSVLALTGAIGLLMRLEWARRIFIGVLVLAIAANLMGLWLQHEVVHTVVQSTLQRAVLPPTVAEVFGGFVTASRVMAVLVTLGVCGLMAWIIRRLMSPSVKQEFA